MEIEVGEYVRTKAGYIAKITEIDNFIWFNEKINKESGIVVYELSKTEFKNLVVKHSFNIIDLIEEDDYINGEKVTAIYDEYKNDGHIKFETNYEGRYRDYMDEDIKTIVTKEMFASAEYREE